MTARPTPSSGLRLRLPLAGLAAILGFIVATSPFVAVSLSGLGAIAIAPSSVLLAMGVALTRPLAGMEGVPESIRVIPVLVLAMSLAKSVMGDLSTRKGRPLTGGQKLGSRHFGFALALFFSWALMRNAGSGFGLTPLLQIAIYAAVGWGIASAVVANSAVRLLKLTVVGYALLEAALSVPSEFPERVFGIFSNDPHQMGFTAIAALSVLLSDKSFLSSIRRPAVIILLLGAISTQTRAVWLGLVIVALVHLLRQRLTAWRVTGLVALLGAAAIFSFQTVTEAFSLSTASANIRLESLRLGLGMIESNPIAGVGWAATTQDTEFAADVSSLPFNLYSGVWSQLGIVGLSLLLAAIGIMLRAAVLSKGPGLYYIAAFLSLGLSGMPLYPGSLVALLFFTLGGLEVRRMEEISIGSHDEKQRDRSISDASSYGATPWIRSQEASET